MTEIWVSIGGSNGLLPVGTKTLTSTNVDPSSKVFFGIHLRAMPHEVLTILICNMCLEITLLKLISHLPGANDFLTLYGLVYGQGNLCLERWKWTYFMEYTIYEISQ